MATVVRAVECDRCGAPARLDEKLRTGLVRGTWICPGLCRCVTCKGARMVGRDLCPTCGGDGVFK